MGRYADSGERRHLSRNSPNGECTSAIPHQRCARDCWEVNETNAKVGGLYLTTRGGSLRRGKRLLAGPARAGRAQPRNGGGDSVAPTAHNKMFFVFHVTQKYTAPPPRAQMTHGGGAGVRFQKMLSIFGSLGLGEKKMQFKVNPPAIVSATLMVSKLRALAQISGGDRLPSIPPSEQTAS